MVRAMTRARKILLCASTLSLAVPLLVTQASPAAADDTIKHPGDHPSYAVEVEPHLLLGWGGGWGGGGLGVGGRFSIPVVQNGFVPSINDSVAIGFGLDVLFYNNCYYSNANGCSATGFVFPVVMQWNFFVAQRWSVFGEPGLAIYHNSWNCNGACPGCGPADTFLEPALYLGGRYHLTDSIALTLRVGFPSFSFGGSFFL
jgi:hypothetical protein